MMMLFDAFVSIAHALDTGRYHPVYWMEHPLPGPDPLPHAVRVKSRGHHTEGFVSRDDAERHAEDLEARLRAHAPAVHRFPPAVFLHEEPTMDGWCGVRLLDRPARAHDVALRSTPV